MPTDVPPATCKLNVPGPVVNVIELSELVKVPKTGFAAVDPKRTCPFVPTINDVKLPDTLPTCTEWLVVPVRLNDATPPNETGLPVTVILLPLDNVMDELANELLGIADKFNVNVEPAPDVEIPEAVLPNTFTLFATGVAIPVLPVKVSTDPDPVIVIVLPDPEVVIPPAPNISILFAIGIAVPESVVKLVGIWGFAVSISMMPA